MLIADVAAYNTKVLGAEPREIGSLSAPDCYVLSAKLQNLLCNPHAGLKFNEGESITISIRKE